MAMAVVSVDARNTGRDAPGGLRRDELLVAAEWSQTRAPRCKRGAFAQPILSTCITPHQDGFAAWLPGSRPILKPMPNQSSATCSGLDPTRLASPSNPISKFSLARSEGWGSSRAGSADHRVILPSQEASYCPIHPTSSLAAATRSASDSQRRPHQATSEVGCRVGSLKAAQQGCCSCDHLDFGHGCDESPKTPKTASGTGCLGR
jgi:hypothetical protein